jgi:hypothetical protein
MENTELNVNTQYILLHFINLLRCLVYILYSWDFKLHIVDLKSVRLRSNVNLYQDFESTINESIEFSVIALGRIRYKYILVIISFYMQYIVPIKSYENYICSLPPRIPKTMINILIIWFRFRATLRLDQSPLPPFLVAFLP